MFGFRNREQFGKIGQDVLINFLEKHFGYRFLAGERMGVVENVEFIEEVENCEYIPPMRYSGSKLIFNLRGGRKSRELTMPDFMMARDWQEKMYWVEVKRHEKSSDEIIIDKENFDDYCEIYTKYTRNKFEVFCIDPINNDNVNVYVAEMQTLIDCHHEERKINGNVVNVWKISATMKKINRYPIVFKRYM